MAIQTIYVQRHDDPEATVLFARLKRHEDRLQGLFIERVYRLEGEFNPENLLPLFINPVFETCSTMSRLDPTAGPIVEIGYRPAVTDPETPSILTAAHDLGQKGLVWARMAHRYQFIGLSEDEALRLAHEWLCNPVVQ
ncbi:MAG: hypothetical protein GX493_07830 [Firmicutes bacterium]|nr:hypothetical protein [Bacillota bacterium]